MTGKGIFIQHGTDRIFLQRSMDGDFLTIWQACRFSYNMAEIRFFFYNMAGIGFSYNMAKKDKDYFYRIVGRDIYYNMYFLTAWQVMRFSYNMAGMGIF